MADDRKPSKGKGPAILKSSEKPADHLHAAQIVTTAGKGSDIALSGPTTPRFKHAQVTFCRTVRDMVDGGRSTSVQERDRGSVRRSSFWNRYLPTSVRPHPHIV
ncbi:hypothetical protein ACOMHN_009594 [Nucella lapillus]